MVADFVDQDVGDDLAQADERGFTHTVGRAGFNRLEARTTGDGVAPVSSARGPAAAAGASG